MSPAGGEFFLPAGGVVHCHDQVSLGVLIDQLLAVATHSVIPLLEIDGGQDSIQGARNLILRGLSAALGSRFT